MEIWSHLIQNDQIIKYLKDKSPKEILSYLIPNKEKESEYYKKLAENSYIESAKALFSMLSEENLKHGDELYNEFKLLYPEEEPIELDLPLLEIKPPQKTLTSVTEYLKVLRVCMNNELLEKEIYEILARVSMDEKLKLILSQMSRKAQQHYEELKELYDLLLALSEDEVKLKEPSPRGYLFSSKFKSRYFLMNILDNRKSMVITRDDPETIKGFFKKEIEVYWITNVPVIGSISPERFEDSKKFMVDFLKQGNTILVIEGIEHLNAKIGFKKLFEILTYLKDHAIVSKSFLLISGDLNTFEEKNKGLLISEFEFIS